MYSEHDQDLCKIINIMEALSSKEDVRKLAKDFEIARCTNRLEALLKFNVNQEKWERCVSMMEKAIKAVRKSTFSSQTE